MYQIPTPVAYNNPWGFAMSQDESNNIQGIESDDEFVEMLLERLEQAKLLFNDESPDMKRLYEVLHRTWQHIDRLEKYSELQSKFLEFSLWFIENEYLEEQALLYASDAGRYCNKEDFDKAKPIWKEFLENNPDSNFISAMAGNFFLVHDTEEGERLLKLGIEKLPDVWFLPKILMEHFFDKWCLSEENDENKKYFAQKVVWTAPHIMTHLDSGMPPDVPQIAECAWYLRDMELCKNLADLLLHREHPYYWNRQGAALFALIDFHEGRKEKALEFFRNDIVDYFPDRLSIAVVQEALRQGEREIVLDFVERKYGPDVHKQIAVQEIKEGKIPHFIWWRYNIEIHKKKTEAQAE